MQVRQLGNPQLHRDNLRQAKVPFVQRRLDDGKPRHQPVEIDFGAVGAAQEPFEIGSRADNPALLMLLDQRRAPEEQPVLGAREPEAPIPAFAQAPEVNVCGNHDSSHA
jgi:hypothetical protein